MPTECAQVNSLSTSTKQPITAGRKNSNNAINGPRNTASGVRCCSLQQQTEKAIVYKIRIDRCVVCVCVCAVCMCKRAGFRDDERNRNLYIGTRKLPWVSTPHLHHTPNLSAFRFGLCWLGFSCCDCSCPRLRPRWCIRSSCAP